LVITTGTMWCRWPVWLIPSWASSSGIVPIQGGFTVYIGGGVLAVIIIILLLILLF